MPSSGPLFVLTTTFGSSTTPRARARTYFSPDGATLFHILSAMEGQCLGVLEKIVGEKLVQRQGNNVAKAAQSVWRNLITGDLNTSYPLHNAKPPILHTSDDFRKYGTRIKTLNENPPLPPATTEGSSSGVGSGARHSFRPESAESIATTKSSLSMIQ